MKTKQDKKQGLPIGFSSKADEVANTYTNFKDAFNASFKKFVEDLQGKIGDGTDKVSVLAVQIGSAAVKERLVKRGLSSNHASVLISNACKFARFPSRRRKGAGRKSSGKTGASSDKKTTEEMVFNKSDWKNSLENIVASMFSIHDATVVDEVIAKARKRALNAKLQSKNIKK